MRPTTLESHPLAVAFRLLQAMGKSGEYVWMTSRLYPAEARLEYLRTAIVWLRKKAAEHNDGRVRYRELPVDFETFVNCPMLLKKHGALWPEVMKASVELNNGEFVEAVLTGGIGVAKTTIAIYTQAYQLYLLSVLEDPHKLFDLDSASEILIIYQSINKHLAADVDYARFRSMLMEAPYFRTVFAFDADKQSVMTFPRNIKVKPVAGHDTAAIGQNVIGGIIDEVNFMAVVENSKAVHDGGKFDQAERNYNTIARRRESRFMQMGTLPGMLCLVSSRNYPGQLTDRKEEEARRQIARTGKTTIYLYDKRLWELRPDRFSGETFDVFIGDDSRKPRLVEADDDIHPEDRRLVMAIPEEYRTSFENDLLSALRDIAGIATLALHPFMLNTEAVVSGFGQCESIASRTECDFRSTKLEIYPKRIKNPLEPRFAHIDLALSKDSAGVSIGHVVGFKSIDRGDHQEMLPIVQFDMILEVRPPRGGEIEFANIRRLFYTLRDKLGMPIKWVSFDQYQSRDSMQIMHQEGFLVGYQSMDIDTDAYDLTKAAFYDGRVIAPEHAKAQKEMITLEINYEKKKIDHPPNGSKDVSDSMAGVIYGLTMRRELWVRHGVPTHRIPKLLTAKGQSKDSLNQKEQADRRTPEKPATGDELVAQRMAERRAR